MLHKKILGNFPKPEVRYWVQVQWFWILDNDGHKNLTLKKKFAYAACCIRGNN